MNKIYLFPLLMMIAFLIPSCGSDDDNDSSTGGSQTSQIENATYNGKLIVNGSFTKDSTDCQIVFNETKDSLTLNIFSVKFAEQMPVSIDISIPGILCSATDGKVTFSGTNITPCIGVVPAPAYLFSEIQGEIENSELKYSAVCTMGTFTFTGIEKPE